MPRRDLCAKCGLPLFIAERLNVGKQLYHRTCFRCARCNSQLTLNNYYETETENQFCCETCPDEEKPIVTELESNFILSRSLSDEEKTAGLLQFNENDDYSQLFETALESNTTLGKSDSLSSQHILEYISARSDFLKSQIEKDASSDNEEPPSLPTTKPPDITNSDITEHSKELSVNKVNTNNESFDCELKQEEQPSGSFINSISDSNQLTRTASFELDDKNVVTKEVVRTNSVSVKERMRLFENKREDKNIGKSKHPIQKKYDFPEESSVDSSVKPHAPTLDKVTEIPVLDKHDKNTRSDSINNLVLGTLDNKSFDIEKEKENELSNNKVKPELNTTNEETTKVLFNDALLEDSKDKRDLDQNNFNEIRTESETKNVEETLIVTNSEVVEEASPEIPQENKKQFEDSELLLESLLDSKSDIPDEDSGHEISNQTSPNPFDDENVAVEDANSIEYPNELNPFDDEEDFQIPVPTVRKKIAAPNISLNPFGSDDNDEDFDSPIEIRNKRLIPANRLSLNWNNEHKQTEETSPNVLRYFF